MRRRVPAAVAVSFLVAVGTVVAVRYTALRPWADGSVHGRWRAVFNGYGEVRGDDDHVLLAPRVAGRPDHTHAALVVTRRQYADLAMSLSLRTESQLRGHRPNAWEVGWVLWQYRDPARFYAVALKPDGWEVSKQDPSYPRGQRFLASGTSPTFPVGGWHSVSVVHLGNTLKVSADGRLLTSFTDSERPYTSGAVGLYSEDARVHFRDVQLLALPSDPQESPDS